MVGWVVVGWDVGWVGEVECFVGVVGVDVGEVVGCGYLFEYW